MNHFSIGLWHRRKSGLYTTTGDNQLNGWTKKKLPKHFPKSNLHQKKCHGQCLVVPVCSTTAFWNPSETIICEKYAQQIDEMRWKLQCLQSVLVNRMGLILLQDNAQLHVTQPTLQKLNEIVYKVLPHPQYSPDLLPTTTSSSISTTCCRENAPTTRRKQKMVIPRVCQIPKHRFLCYRNKQTCFSLAKMSWL